MITPSDDRQRPDAGKGAMEIDWPDPGNSALVHAYLGHPASFGVGRANAFSCYRLFTVRGA
jgi:hypothetical protein